MQLEAAFTQLPEVCRGFLNGIAVAKSDLQNNNSYSARSFGTSTAYGIGFFDGYITYGMAVMVVWERKTV